MITVFRPQFFSRAAQKTDFYSSISREKVGQFQIDTGIKISLGLGWVHLDWIANPDHESYVVQKRDGENWTKVDTTKFGSSLLYNQGGTFQVNAVSNDTGCIRLLGEVEVQAQAFSATPVYKPVISGPWQLLFKSQKCGYYINDHTVFKNSAGDRRLVGITSKTDGDSDRERYFAVGVSKDLPPGVGMQECATVANFGELAFAPHVINEAGKYYMYWSPSRLERMT